MLDWIWNFLLSFFAPRIAEDIGPLILLIFFGMLVFGFVYVYLFIPETKGLSLEQVDLLYQNSTPLSSQRYREEILAQDIHVADIKEDHQHHDNVSNEKVESA